MKLLITLMILLAVVLLVGFPFAVIWALNSLFTLGIPYALHTWTAVWVLCAIFSTNVNIRKD